MGKTNTVWCLALGIPVVSSDQFCTFHKNGAKSRKRPDIATHMDENSLRIRGVEGKFRELCKQADGLEVRVQNVVSEKATLRATTY